jgi:hypothetical protein
MTHITPAWKRTYYDYYVGSDIRAAVKTVMYHVFQYHRQEGEIWTFTRREVAQQPPPAGGAAPAANLAPIEIEQCARAAAAAALFQMSSYTYIILSSMVLQLDMQLHLHPLYHILIVKSNVY